MWSRITPELTEAVLKGRTPCKILSVNIPGLRALLNKPDRKKIWDKLMAVQNPDILLLQEHKLQPSHLETDLIRSFVKTDLKDYKAYWSFSEVKKGYSGVATFIKKSIADQFPVLNVGYKMKNMLKDGKEAHIFDDEGRLVILEFDKFYLINVYVPNSGMKLDKLSPRTKIWDRVFEAYFKHLEEDGKKPVLAIGDMNVAFRIQDMHNFYHKSPKKFEDLIDPERKINKDQYVGLKQLAKQAGCTPEERSSFKKLLGKGIVDTFVHFNKDVEGCFTFWSHRSDNKPFNQGLRLDYVLASPELVREVDTDGVTLLNTFHLDGNGPEEGAKLNDKGVWGLSDHCPLGCVLLL